MFSPKAKISEMSKIKINIFEEDQSIQSNDSNVDSSGF
jgi:hypothetical protein